MKVRSAVVLSLLTGAAVGAAAVQTLHAQAKPPAYVIGEITVTNPDAYLKEYAPISVKALQDAGGKFLVRGGKTAVIEGDLPKGRIVVIAYESVEKAQAAFASPAYKDARKIGDKYATFHTYAIESPAQ